MSSLTEVTQPRFLRCSDTHVSQFTERHAAAVSVSSRRQVRSVELAADVADRLDRKAKCVPIFGFRVFGEL